MALVISSTRNNMMELRTMSNGKRIGVCNGCFTDPEYIAGFFVIYHHIQQITMLV